MRSLCFKHSCVFVAEESHGVSWKKKFSVIKKLTGRTISRKCACWVVIIGQMCRVWVAMRQSAQDARQVSHNLFLSLVFNQFRAYTVNTCARRRKNEHLFGNALFLKVSSLLYHGQLPLSAVSPSDCYTVWVSWQSVIGKVLPRYQKKKPRKKTGRWTFLMPSSLHDPVRSALTQRGHTVSGHDNA